MPWVAGSRIRPTAQCREGPGRLPWPTDCRDVHRRMTLRSRASGRPCRDIRRSVRCQILALQQGRESGLRSTPAVRFAPRGVRPHSLCQCGHEPEHGEVQVSRAASRVGDCPHAMECPELPRRSLGGECIGPGEHLAWFHPAECSARAGVELESDGVERVVAPEDHRLDVAAAVVSPLVELRVDEARAKVRQAPGFERLPPAGRPSGSCRRPGAGRLPVRPSQPLSRGREWLAGPASRVVMRPCAVSAAKRAGVRRASSDIGLRGSGGRVAVLPHRFRVGRSCEKLLSAVELQLADSLVESSLSPATAMLTFASSSSRRHRRIAPPPAGTSVRAGRARATELKGR